MAQTESWKGEVMGCDYLMKDGFCEMRVAVTGGKIKCPQHSAKGGCSEWVTEYSETIERLEMEAPESECKKDPKSRYYDAGGIEVFDIIKAKLTPEQFKGYLLGNMIKYSCRANFKGDFERDIQKIGFYEMWLSEALSDGEKPHTAPPGPRD